MHGRGSSATCRTAAGAASTVLIALLLLAGCGGGSSAAAPPATAPAGATAATKAGTPQAAAPKTPTPTRSATPARTPAPAAAQAASIAGPPASWPNASNTGYKNAPGYPGKLATFTGTIESNHTYKFLYFPGETFVGNWDGGVQNVTFYGCLFAGAKVDDATVADYSDNVTFDYSTFAPLKASAPPVAHDAGSQYSIDQRRPGKLTVDHSDFWGFAEGIQLGYSTKDKPFAVRNSWFHDTRADGGTDHTDAILSSDGGPDFMVIDHDTIVSAGNTNGLAFQYSDVYYSDVTVTGNYFSGFGYTVNVGGDGKGNQRITFTGNTFGTDLRPVWGPLYGWGGSNVVWRDNKWHVAPGGFDKQAADDGKYWWPDGTLSGHDYTG